MTHSHDEAQSAAEHRAARLLQLAVVPPRALDASGWHDVVERATRPRRDWRLVPAFAVSVLVGVAGVLLVQDLKGAGVDAPTVVASSGARWSRTERGVFSLQTGRLSVPQGMARVTVETPDVVIQASHAAFLAEVTAGRTVVQVEQGEVVVRIGRAEHVVHTGESLQWPDLPASLHQPAATGSRCALDLSKTSRVDCLEAEARGDSLDAQAALYELGALRAKQGDVDGAVATWTSSLARFPDGVLEPEVRLALFVELLSAKRLEDAQVVGRDFERCCAEDPRALDVRRVLRTLAR